MKKYIISAFIMIFFAFGACFTYCTEQSEEAIIFGGYCYYIENGNIFRAPITALTGDIELFREDSLAIFLDGTDLVSLSSDGDFTSYSLISENEQIFESIEFNSSGDDELILGSLSAKYESNGNPAAISKGNDAGGVSFGAYQFASNAGVPKAFSDWCISSGASLDIGNRLIAAYKKDGSVCGENFKAEWLAIANENADLFLKIQHRYVKEKYYDAIVARIEKNIPEFNIDIYGIALKNVFWSRSVQHGVGGSYNVITRAFEAIGGFNMQSEDVLIRAIYAESGAVVDTGTYPMTGTTAENLGIAGKYMKYYSKNSSAVQISVYKRLNINELALALEMLEKYGGYEPPIGFDFEFNQIFSDSITENSARISATLNNYRSKNITEYGFFLGKSLNSLVDVAMFFGSNSDPSISFTKRITDTLESGTTYYYGAYAFIGGEYITSDIFSFKTLNEVKFKVSYLNYDGTLLYETTVKKGDTAQFTGKDPKRASNAQYSYVFCGWDNDGKNIESDTYIYAVYSRLDHLWDGSCADSFSSGDGSPISPYIISTPAELAYLSQIVNSGFDTSGVYFKLSNNIVLGYGKNSIDFTPIGTKTAPFEGVFLGCGYKIIGLSASKAKHCGLFGVMTSGRIESLIIENAKIDGEISGALVGSINTDNTCEINDCFVIGNVHGKDYAGGIIGFCEGDVSIQDVYFEGEVDSNICGGLIGHFKGNIVKNAFAISITTGENNDAVCASFSSKDSFVNCFYLECDVSNLGNSVSTEEQSKPSSYSGFDFVNKWTLDDNSAVLKISATNDYSYYVYGDLNTDGDLNIYDAMLFAQYLAGWKLDITLQFKNIADLNGDGNLSIFDFLLLVQYLAGWKITLPK